MAPSRSRGKAGARSNSAVLRLFDNSRDPMITLDTGTPLKSQHSSGANSVSSSPRPSSLSREASPHFLRPKSVASESSASSSGPRPSIDDDNVEGDQDTASPTGDLNGSNLSDDDGLFEDDDMDAVQDGLLGESHFEGTATTFPSSALGSTSSLQRSNSTPVLIPPTANAFAPPFYNRPPTPLPPSPSLTSLLRPSFSSRPTTPDDSESEVAASGAGTEGAATEAAVEKSARDARTVPRASPKVPTYEYYGFVLYLTSGLCFLMYLLWSYLPSPFLHQLGIYYYPNRWWSLAVPSFLVMLLVYIYIALAAYNTEYLTPPLGSITNVVDDAANVAAFTAASRNRPSGGGGSNSSSGSSSKVVKKSTDKARVRRLAGSVGSRDASPDWGSVWNEGTDAVMDVPIGGVCEILYGRG